MSSTVTWAGNSTALITAALSTLDRVESDLPFELVEELHRVAARINQHASRELLAHEEFAKAIYVLPVTS